MTQGIWVAGRRPTTKKAIKEAVATDPSRVEVEATSFFGNEYEGPATEMPEGKTIYFVGPDPHTARKFYGQLSRTGDKVVVK
jgi:hypothetical protein